MGTSATLDACRDFLPVCLSVSPLMLDQSAETQSTLVLPQGWLLLVSTGVWNVGCQDNM